MRSQAFKIINVIVSSSLSIQKNPSSHSINSIYHNSLTQSTITQQPKIDISKTRKVGRESIGRGGEEGIKGRRQTSSKSSTLSASTIVSAPILHRTILISIWGFRSVRFLVSLSGYWPMIYGVYIFPTLRYIYVWELKKKGILLSDFLFCEITLM